MMTWRALLDAFYVLARPEPSSPRAYSRISLTAAEMDVRSYNRRALRSTTSVT